MENKMYINTPQTKLGNGLMKKSINIEDIFPVGSTYIGDMTICPISLLLPNSVWELVATSIIIANGDIPVVGNGKTLGLTNGKSNYGLYVYNGNSVTRLQPKDTAYGTNAGTSLSGGIDLSTTTFGITTEAKNSGLVAKVESISLKVNIWKRTS